MNLVGRLGGSWYCKTDENSLFELSQPMQKTIGYDALPEEIKQSKVLTANDIGKLAAQPTIPTTEEIDNALEQFGLGDIHQTAKKLIIDGQIRSALALFYKN
ncbi:MAG: flavin reductase family protein, partial [Crocinitomicaceae bacterium]|nr:flavin reductase family protein [Crocinitomicaceae bacterium]